MLATDKMLWTCGESESEGNPGKHHITRKASKTAVGRCKGMNSLSLNQMLEPEDRMACRKHVSRVAPTIE